MPFDETEEGYEYNPKGTKKIRTTWPSDSRRSVGSRKAIRQKLREMLTEDLEKLHEQGKGSQQSDSGSSDS